MSKYQFTASNIYIPGTDLPENLLGINEPELLHEIEHLSEHSPCQVSSEPALHQQGVKLTVLFLTWFLLLIFLRALPYPVHPRMPEPSQA